MCSHRRFLPPPNRRLNLLPPTTPHSACLRTYHLRLHQCPNPPTRRPLDRNSTLPTGLPLLWHLAPQFLVLLRRYRLPATPTKYSSDPASGQASRHEPRGGTGPEDHDGNDVSFPARLFSGCKRGVACTFRDHAGRGGKVGWGYDWDVTAWNSEAWGGGEADVGYWAEGSNGGFEEDQSAAARYVLMNICSQSVIRAHR